MTMNLNTWYWAMGTLCLVGLLSNYSALFGTLNVVVRLPVGALLIFSSRWTKYDYNCILKHLECVLLKVYLLIRIVVVYGLVDQFEHNNCLKLYLLAL